MFINQEVQYVCKIKTHLFVYYTFSCRGLQATPNDFRLQLKPSPGDFNFIWVALSFIICSMKDRHMHGHCRTGDQQLLISRKLLGNYWCVGERNVPPCLFLPEKGGRWTRDAMFFFFLHKDLCSHMGQTKWTARQFPVSDLAKRHWWSACTVGLKSSSSNW